MAGTFTTKFLIPKALPVGQLCKGYAQILIHTEETPYRVIAVVHNEDSMQMISAILEKLYFISPLRKIICKILRKIQKNEVDNEPLRRIFKRYHNISIGKYSYGGCFDLTKIPSGVTIGNFCSFASEVMIIPNDHLISAVSTHPFLFKQNLGVVDKDPRKHFTLNIGHDVWVGFRVIILSSVKEIGHGSVIAAGSIVTHDVPPYAVVAGVPAKITKYRFDEKIINQLLESRWWDWPDEKIFTNYRRFYSPEEFLK